jgi:FMN reductase (NADPH)/FMN reductase [NAD(P)H]
MLELIHDRRSVRSYEDRPVSEETVDQLLAATLRAPTAGNMMLYSIIEIADQELKDKLAVSCDHQPFIAKAPLVWLFAADYQRWWDYFRASDVDELVERTDLVWRTPGEGDLMLACCDALIAAQTAVLAAEALGLGSCYIGDILERFEYHRDLLALPPYVVPVTMLCLGYPSAAARRRALTPRFDRRYIVHRDRYHRASADELEEMMADHDQGRYFGEAENFGQSFYARKFAADFSVEMTRSMRAAIEAWVAGE